MVNTQQLRIAMISEHASPLAAAGGSDAGGQVVYVDGVARCLAALGHRVDVLTRRDDPGLPAVIEIAPGVRVLHVEAGPARYVPKEQLLSWMPAFANQSHFLLRGEGRYDAIHANFFMSGWAGLLLRPTLHAPLVTTFHELGLVRREHHGASDRFPLSREAIERTLVRSSDCVIAACPQERSDLMRLYGARSDHMAMISCGVDTTLFRPGHKAAARQRLGLDPGEFIVLQLGRMVPCKGIDNVVRALSLIPSQVPARLVVVGGESRTPDFRRTPELGTLMRLAAEQGVGTRVLFVGQRDREELRDWYVSADVFVSTPWYEPFGSTPLEAMACGTPVVGSDLGGIRHTVQDGRTGFLVPPHHPEALAQRLLVLHQDPRRAQLMGQAGRERVLQHFTWQAVASQFVEVFETLRHQPWSGPRRLRCVGAAPQVQHADLR